MPPLETSDLNQKAALWTHAGYNGNGDLTVGAPVEIDVRWNTVKRVIFDANDNPITIVAEVVVDREIATESLLRLGELDDVPDTPDQLHKLAIINTTPDLKARNYRRTLQLTRFEEPLRLA